MDEEVVRWLPEVISHLHLVQLGDARHSPLGEMNRCLLGTGSVPLQTILDTLRDHGYSGPLGSGTDRRRCRTAIVRSGARSHPNVSGPVARSGRKEIEFAGVAIGSMLPSVQPRRRFSLVFGSASHAALIAAGGVRRKQRDPLVFGQQFSVDPFGVTLGPRLAKLGRPNLANLAVVVPGAFEPRGVPSTHGDLAFILD